MVKELAFDMNPLIKSYQYYSYPIGILKSNNYINYQYSLLMKFKTIFFAENIQFHVDEYEFWNAFKITIKDDLDNKNVLTEIIKAINSNQYIHLTSIDEYYIPSRNSYDKYHYLHDILIIGYDEDELISIGYDLEGIYKKENIKANLLTNALTDKTKVKYIKVNNTELELDYKDIKEGLDSYFTSNTLCLFNTNDNILDVNSWFYGINSMDKMIVKMRAMENEFLFNNLLLCIESKHLILNKLEKMEIYLKHPQMIVEYKEITKKYEIIRLKIFKKIIKKVNFIEEIDQFEQVYSIEKQFAERWKDEKNML